MGFLDPPPLNSFLYPFLDGLPATRVVLGMSQDEGGSLRSEDVGYREFTLALAPAFGCTQRGVGYLVLNGTTQYATAVDANWNSPLLNLTVICVHYRDTAPAGGTGLVTKLPGGPNNGFGLYYSNANTLIGYVTSDGGSGGAQTVGHTVDSEDVWSVGVMRFTAGSELKVWGRQTGGAYTANDDASAITGIHNSSASLYLGRKEAAGDEDYLQGSIALVAIYAVPLTDGVIDKLINHCISFGVG